jgi:ribosomal protein S18 acetylase RimI-like enzyme
MSAQVNGLKSGLGCVVKDYVDPEELRSILAGLSDSHSGPTSSVPDRNQLPISCVIRASVPEADENDTGAVIGGLIGATCWNWLSVKYLWVCPTQRGKGLGKTLMDMVEEYARTTRGCIGSHVDTHSFQAKDFYLRLGYVVVGEIEDYPVGHSRIYLKKRFPSNNP